MYGLKSLEGILLKKILQPKPKLKKILFQTYNLNMSEDIKIKLRKIAVESYDKKLAPRDIAKEMTSQIDDLSIKHAQVIARTETARVANVSSYINAKLNMHVRSFTVKSGSDCCSLCAKTYGNGSIVFDIEQNDMIPPIHDECRCFPQFRTRPADGFKSL